MGWPGYHRPFRTSEADPIRDEFPLRQDQTGGAVASRSKTVTTLGRASWMEAGIYNGGNGLG